MEERWWWWGLGSWGGKVESGLGTGNEKMAISGGIFVPLSPLKEEA